MARSGKRSAASTLNLNAANLSKGSNGLSTAVESAVATNSVGRKNLNAVAPLAGERKFLSGHGVHLVSPFVYICKLPYAQDVSTKK